VHGARQDGESILLADAVESGDGLEHWRFPPKFGGT
jgi:hypothetical protein